MAVVFPVLIPLIVAALMMMMGPRRRHLQRTFSVAGSALHVASCVVLFGLVQNGPQQASLGGWQPPYGISLFADELGATMALVGAVVGLLVLVFSLDEIDAKREAFGYHPLVHALLGGVTGAFLTHDLFNLYVWFEVTLMASFVLMALGGSRRQMIAAFKYMPMNFIGSTLLLAACGLTYGLAGTLNMADLASKLPDAPPGLVLTVASLLLLAFGIKAAVFPFYSWLPATYHTPPFAVTALFSALLTKLGVVSMYRMFLEPFASIGDGLLPVLVVVAGLTMVSGVLGAIAQNDFRQVLTFHIVSQIGYLILGLAIGTAAGVTAGIFYTVHVIIVKTALLLIAGIACRIQGTNNLKKMGGLAASHPWLAALFLVSALSLAGIPPLSGFWAKFGVVSAGLGSSAWIITGIALGVGMLTLFSMIKIWNAAFWGPAPEKDESADEAAAAVPAKPKIGWKLIVPTAALAFASVVIGLVPGPLSATIERYSARSFEAMKAPAVVDYQAAEAETMAGPGFGTTARIVTGREEVR